MRAGERQQWFVFLSSFKKVKLEFNGVGPSVQMLQGYATNSLLSPLKPGAKSNIPKWAYNSLCVVSKSYTHINRLNRRDKNLTLKKLAAKVNETMNHKYCSKLLICVLLSTAILMCQRWSTARTTGFGGQCMQALVQ